MFDIVIKTFDRYSSLHNLLTSIEQYYPDHNIIIADDSVDFNKKFYKHNLNMEVLHLGVDVGLSYGRNKAMERVTTKYALLLDDDFIFDERTDIDKLMTIAKHTKADVVGGRLDTNGKIDGYNQFLDITDGVLTYTQAPEQYEEYKGIRYHQTDIVYNFGLFQKGSRWDEKIKIKGEHVDYFLQAKKKKKKVIHCPDVIIRHDPKRPQHYQKYRQRNDGFYYLMKKYKLYKIISATGSTVEKKDNQLITYRTEL